MLSRMRASQGLGIAGIVVALLSPSAASAEPEGASKGAAAQAPPVHEPNVRVGLVYAPTILVSDASRSGAIDDPLHGVSTGAHHLGVELALGSGYFRYHLTFAFSAATGATGLRIEPTTLGLAIPLLKKPAFRLEVEPTAMILNVSYLGASDAPGSLATVSSGADVRANLTIGKHFFVSASPLGFDVRYAGIDASAAKAKGFAGAAAYYRLRLVIGAEF